MKTGRQLLLQTYSTFPLNPISNPQPSLFSLQTHPTPLHASLPVWDPTPHPQSSILSRCSPPGPPSHLPPGGGQVSTGEEGMFPLHPSMIADMALGGAHRGKKGLLNPTRRHVHFLINNMRHRARCHRQNSKGHNIFFNST